MNCPQCGEELGSNSTSCPRCYAFKKSLERKRKIIDVEKEWTWLPEDRPLT